MRSISRDSKSVHPLLQRISNDSELTIGQHIITTNRITGEVWLDGVVASDVWSEQMSGPESPSERRVLVRKPDGSLRPYFVANLGIRPTAAYKRVNANNYTSVIHDKTVDCLAPAQ